MRRVRGRLPSADRVALTRRELLRFGIASGVAALWAPNVWAQVTGRIDRRVTQMFFPGEPLNEQDLVLQSVPRDRDRLVAAPHPAPPDEDPATRLLRWDIVLRQG